MTDLMTDLPSNRREAALWVKRYWAEVMSSVGIEPVAHLKNPYLEELFARERERLAARIAPGTPEGPALIDKLARFVRRSGARGCTERELRHGLHRFRTSPRDARQALLTALVASGGFQYVRIAQTGRGGAARNAIVAIEHIEE